MSVRRLGMFGGAFDPPHRAHRALAEAAVAQLVLDELRVFPTGQAWHKARTLAPAVHRLAMARLAFEGARNVVVDDAELRRAGATYTVDTLRELHAAEPAAELFLIMGDDQAAAFTTWRDWPAIAQMATLAVAGRPGAANAAALPPGTRVQRLSLPPMAESATRIRELLTTGQDARHLVDPRVARYIASHHLYSEP